MMEYLAKVPCNGCRLCCINDLVRLLPADLNRGYKTEPHPMYPKTQLMIAHKPNGECIYLNESGCSIHDNSPQMCREMDCRNIMLQ